MGQRKAGYLLQADFSVSSSGETYWAVPTNELALADEKRGEETVMLRQRFHRGCCHPRSPLRTPQSPAIHLYPPESGTCWGPTPTSPSGAHPRPKAPRWP